jgi:hypothetical protein
MELNELMVNGDGTAVVMWRGKIAVRLRPFSGEMERRAQRIVKPQYRGHNRTEDKVDPIALRDFYCDEIVTDIEGLTKDGEPFGKSKEDRRMLWDATPDFRVFVINAANEAANFEAEKNG